MRIVSALVLVGCGRDAAKPTTVPTSSNDPQIRFALTSDREVQIVHVADTKLVVERATTVPATVSHLFWAGPSPAVWLDASIGMMGEGFPGEGPPGPHQNEIGLVEPTGYKKLTLPTWPPAKPLKGDEDLDEVTTPNHGFVATADALWERRCRWFGGPDGGACAYEYARLFPAPVVFRTYADIGSTNPERLFPEVAASSAIKLSYFERPRAREDAPPQQLLLCEQGGKKIEFPSMPSDESDAGSVTWLSTEPPIFMTQGGYPDEGFGNYYNNPETIWVGCDYQYYTKVFPGPDGVVVLTGNDILVLQRGREIARSATPADLVVFAPQR